MTLAAPVSFQNEVIPLLKIDPLVLYVQYTSEIQFRL
jgi:hypothetical protein